MTDSTTETPNARTIRRYGVAIALAGAAIQLLLGIYYLAMAHSPQPHDLPVGLVATKQQAQAITEQLESDGQFEVETYANAADLTEAIKSRDAYGGVVIANAGPTLYVASAASPAVANLLKASYSQVYYEKLGPQAGPPTIVDAVPLPADDSAGGSLGFMIQAIALGGSIASLALGQLRRMWQRSLLNGFRHAGLLVAYALLSAGVALVAMSFFGVSSGADTWSLFWGFAFISLAITASIAAAVTLVGPAGTSLGMLYFTLGIIISGSSIAPEMLPTAGRVIGQLLPPGAGATVVRDSLYFPDASTAGPFIVLGLFSGVGLLVVLLKNAAASLPAKAPVQPEG
ncbi:ABC transporter permease [Nocardioides humilatus]|uniref:ABC transporter permease n=1 Tax=Nocardioides humilatus TaxID=2607660 RepID=A0A5B1LFB5_9ACTN|nr:ABC transporter permease [Nocardioides humilatus]KAA1419156.1 ABC transporter permease [Nocardioides humilatus]